MLLERGERDDLKGALMGGGEHDRGGEAVLEGAQPVRRGDAPPVSGNQAGKRNCGIGVTRSLPMLRWCSRNSLVTTAQMVWLPRSSGPVVQVPSR